MHELSIATALCELARQKAPAGKAVRALGIRVGPLRGIEPEALQMAWQAATAETDLAGAALTAEYLPWQLQCPECARTFAAAELTATCACGCTCPMPAGSSDELTLQWLEVEE